MKTTILSQRSERDELMSRPYQRRLTRYDADELLHNPLIKLITGPRRVGKSVYALLLLRGRNFAYLNFDDARLLEKWDEEIVMSLLDDVYPGYEYLLLDEVQNLPGWDLWVSKLYRRGKNLIITGSNAKMLSREMATVLTGRYLQIEMLPFSLEETMRWKIWTLRMKIQRHRPLCLPMIICATAVILKPFGHAALPGAIFPLCSTQFC